MHADKYMVREAEIECIDIDRFVRSLVRRVRLLKLDIEGAEIAVINRIIDAGSIDSIDQVAAETHEGAITHLKDSRDAPKVRSDSPGVKRPTICTHIL